MKEKSRKWAEVNATACGMSGKHLSSGDLVL